MRKEIPAAAAGLQEDRTLFQSALHVVEKSPASNQSEDVLAESLHSGINHDLSTNTPEFHQARTRMDIFYQGNRNNNTTGVIEKTVFNHIKDEPHVGIDLTVIPEKKRSEILKALARSATLQSLDLRAPGMPELAEEIIATLKTVANNNPRIQLKLNLSSNDLTSKHLETLCELPSEAEVQVLHINDNLKIREKAVRKIAQLKNLRSLEVGKFGKLYEFSEETLHELQQALPNLKHLGLNHFSAGITPQLYGRIVGMFTQLVSLDLTHFGAGYSLSLRDNILQEDITKLTGLKTLRLGAFTPKALYTAAGLGRLAESLHHLETLDINNSRIGDKGIAEVAKFRNLTHLYAQKCKMTKEGATEAAKLKLHVFDGTKNHLDDDAVNVLHPLHDTLQTLRLSYNREITDASKEALMKFSHLRELDLRRTKITPEAMHTIAAALPNLTRFNGEPYLGKVLEQILPNASGLRKPANRR